MRCAIRTFLFLFWVILLAPLSSWAEFYRTPWRNHHQPRQAFTLIPELSHYSSTTNFDSIGDKIIPSSLNTYSRSHLDLSFRYGLSSSFSIYSRLAMALVSLDTTAFQSSAFGLPDQTFGMNYRILETPTGASIDLQAQIDVPLYSNVNAQEEALPYLGDGSIDITGGGFANFVITEDLEKQLLFSAGAGYTFRTADFSAAIPWSAFLTLSRSVKGLILKAGLDGVASLKTDTATTLGDNATTILRASGGSAFINAPNPTLFNVRASLGYQWTEQLSSSFTFATALSGSNAPQGTLLALNMTFNWGEAFSRRLDRTEMSPNEYGGTNKGFVTYANQGNVTRVNDRLNIIKANIGTDHGVEVGQIYDVFSVTQDGRPKEPVARVRVTSVHSNESAFMILEYYKEVWIEEGFIVRQPLN